MINRYIVIVMILVVLAMFYKGIEVLGRSDTNKDIVYSGPNKTTEERWNAAFEWMKKRNENKSK